MKKFFFIITLLIVSYTAFMSQNFSVIFSKQETQCQLAQANVSTTSSTNYTVNWSNGSSAISINQLEPGEYSVTVTNSLNNDTTITFTIDNLICEPIAQNHFTPNADGFNDTWNIQRIDNFPEFDLYVYNRWGQQVHHQMNQYIPWDGSSLNIPLPDATYYFVLFFSKSDKKNFIKGDVSIIR